MKRLISFAQIFAIVMAVLSISSCEKRDALNELQVPEVSVTLNYQLANGSDMIASTKATSSVVFDEFYAAMTSGELIEPTYDLTFTERYTGAQFKLSGKWADNEMFTLRTGTYTVVGSSTAPGENIQEKCSLYFIQEVYIETTTTSVILQAYYDSALLVFSDSTIASLSNFNGVSSSDFFRYNSYFYAFVNDALYAENYKDKAYITGTHKNNAAFKKVYTGKLKFEKGKYYVYDNFNLAFNLDPMTEGDYQGVNSSAEYVAVDLGLSVKWASFNVGARSEEEIGYRFAWGEVTPDKDYYDWDNYVWYNSDGSFSKYYHGVDGKTKLDDEDDAAKVFWGGAWRMPSAQEATELFEQCTWNNEEVNGVAGFRVIGPNSQSIFIPCNGQFDEGGITHNQAALLWTSENQGDLWAIRLYSQSEVGCNNHRHDGLCIRPVCE